MRIKKQGKKIKEKQKEAVSFHGNPIDIDKQRSVNQKLSLTLTAGQAGPQLSHPNTKTH